MRTELNARPTASFDTGGHFIPVTHVEDQAQEITEVQIGISLRPLRGLPLRFLWFIQAGDCIFFDIVFYDLCTQRSGLSTYYAQR